MHKTRFGAWVPRINLHVYFSGVFFCSKGHFQIMHGITMWSAIHFHVHFSTHNTSIMCKVNWAQQCAAMACTCMHANTHTHPIPHTPMPPGTPTHPAALACFTYLHTMPYFFSSMQQSTGNNWILGRPAPWEVAHWLKRSQLCQNNATACMTGLDM